MPKRSKKGKLYRYDGMTGGMADTRSGAKALLRKDREIFGTAEYEPIGMDDDDWRISEVGAVPAHFDGDYLD